MRKRITPIKRIINNSAKSFMFLGLSLLSIATLEAQELLENPDFETVTILGTPNETSVNFDSWTFDVDADGATRNNTQDLRTETTDVFDGTYSAMIKSGGTKGKITQLVQNIDSTQTYLFSVYLKPSTTSYSEVDFHLKARGYDATGNSTGPYKKVVYKSYPKDDGYVRFGYPLFFNEFYEDLGVEIVCNQARDESGAKVKGAFLVDNASVMAVNEFVNLDFEDGIDYAWRRTLVNDATVTNDEINFYEGSNAASLNLINNDDVATLNNHIRVPLIQGKDYTISAMAKTLVDNGDADSLKIVAKTYDSDHDLVRLFSTKYDISDEFSSYSHTVTVGATEAYMAFDIQVWNQAGNYIIDDITVDEIFSTSNIETKADEKLSLYPNPATSVINISTAAREQGKLKIYSMTGSVVLVKQGVENNAPVSIESLRKGVYLVEFMSNNKIYTSKLIKE